MKIAVASSGKCIDSRVDDHTGRAAFFILYDTEQESYEAIDNWQCSECLHWAGSRAVNLLVAAGADVVVARKIGPCAFRRLADSRIAVFYSDETSVVNTIRSFREGKLPRASEPNCEGHAHGI